MPAALADLGVVAVRHPLDQLMRAHGARRAGDLVVGGAGTPEGDVVPDGAREQEPFLRDDPELRPQRHRGSYDGLTAAHAAVHTWCAEHGHVLTRTRWEVYGD